MKIDKIPIKFFYLSLLFILPSDLLQIFWYYDIYNPSSFLLIFIRNCFSGIGTAIIVTQIFLMYLKNIKLSAFFVIVLLVNFELCQMLINDSPLDVLDVFGYIIGIIISIFFTYSFNSKIVYMR